MAKLTAQINADASQFLKVIQDVLKVAEETQKAVSQAFSNGSDIKIDDSALKQARDSAELLAKEIKGITGGVRVDDSQINQTKKKIDELDGTEANIKVNAESSGLSSLTDAFSGGLIGGLIGGGVAGLVQEGIGAIVSGLGSAINMGLEFNSALGDMQAKTGATKEEMVALKSAAEDAFIGGVGESVAEATNIIANAQTRLGDFLNPEQLSEFTVGAQALANTFDLDVNEVITKASPVIQQFGLDSKEAFDLLAFSAQNGASASDDFLDTLSEYSQLAQEAGFSALQLGESIARGAEAGVFNTDKIGDAIKEAQIRINAGDFESAFKGLSESATEGEKSVIDLVNSIAQKAQSGELSIQEALQLSSAEIDKAFDSGQISESLANSLQVAIAGTPAEDLGRDIYSRIFSAPFDEKLIAEKARKAGESLSGAIGQYTSIEAVTRKFELFVTKLSQGLIAFSDKVIAPIIGGVIEAFAGISEAFNDVFGSFELDSGITDAFDDLLKIFDAIVVVVRDTIGGVFRAVFGTLKGIFTSLYDAVEPIFDLFGELVDLFSSSGEEAEGLGSILKDVGDIIGEIGALVYEWLITPFEFMVDLVVDITKSFLKFTGIIGETDKAGSGFGDTLSVLSGILNNIKGTIGGVTSALSAIKDAFLDLDLADIAKRLLSGENPFAGITDKISSAYDKGFNEATGKFKKSNEEQAKISGSLFAQINSQIEELAKNRANLSNQEISTEKNKLSELISSNLEANKIVKGDAVKLNNALEQIKITATSSTLKNNATTKASFKELGDFLSGDFKEKLKGAFAFNFDNELQLSKSFVDTEGILKGFNEPLNELRTAITGIQFDNGQLDTINAFIDEIGNAIDETQRLKDNIEQTPQFLKNLVDETAKLSNEFGKYADENDKVLKKLQTELTDLQIEFNSAESEEEQVAVLNRLLTKYNEYNDRVLKTAKVSADDRKRLEQQYQNELNELIKNATNLTNEEFNKRLEALRKERDESLKVKEDEVNRIKEAENGLAEFLEARRIDGIKDANEKAKQQELKDLDEKYKQLISKIGVNQELTLKLEEEFRKDKQEIIDKYTQEEIGLLEQLSSAFVQSLATYDASDLIKQNEGLSESIKQVGEDFDKQSEEYLDQLKRGEISQRDYNNAIVELEKKKNDDIKALEDERVGFTEIANANIISSFQALNDTIAGLLAERSKAFAESIESDKEANKSFTQFITDNMGLAVASIGASMGQAVAQGDNAFQSLIASTLKTAQVLLNAWAAPLLLKTSTEVPFGLGTIEFGILLASANALLAVAQAGVGGANDGIVGLTDANKGKPSGADSILMMLAPDESVITASGTAKNRAYLEFINKGGSISDLISPNVSVNANGDMRETNKRLEQNTRELQQLRKDFRHLRVDHFYDKQPNVTVHNNVEIIDRRGVL